MHKEKIMKSGPEMRKIAGSSLSLSAATMTYGVLMFGTVGGEIQQPRCRLMVAARHG